MVNFKKIPLLYVIVGAIIVLIILIIAVRFFSAEDDWIKDSKGVWVKHGNPLRTPDYVTEQQVALGCASEKFLSYNYSMNSQCLGVCGMYAVDLVSVPRSAADNLESNQCQAYLNGSVSHFIELDEQGNIVRVV